VINTSFDEILERAQDKLLEQPSPRSDWKKKIYGLMRNLLSLNEVYDNDKHNVKVERCLCDKCLKTSYVILVRDLDNDERMLRFYQKGWQHLGKNIYNCEQCK